MKKQNELYLSDKQPLNTGGRIFLALSYLIMIVWALFIILPLAIIVVSAFNGNQGKNIFRLSTLNIFLPRPIFLCG